MGYKSQLSEDKAKEIARLSSVARKSKRQFKAVNYNGQTIMVLNASMQYYKSIMFKIDGYRYVLIKSSLSDKEKQMELHIVLSGKELCYFNSYDNEQVEEQKRIDLKERWKKRIISDIEDYIRVAGGGLTYDEFIDMGIECWKLFDIGYPMVKGQIKKELISEIVGMINIQQLTEKDIKMIRSLISGYIEKRIKNNYK